MPPILSLFRIAALLIVFSELSPAMAYAKDFKLSSPDKQLVITVSLGKYITWSVSRGQELLIAASPMSLVIEGSQTLGLAPSLLRSSIRTVQERITAVVPVRNKVISDHFNELRLNFKGSYALEFRAYNDGVAYRFVTSLGNKQVNVMDEQVAFNFDANNQIYLPEEKDPDMQSHYEGDFKKMQLSEISTAQYGYLPLYLSSPSGTKMVLTESDLNNYPNLFLYGNSNTSLTGKFPKVILESALKAKSDRTEIIVKKAAYHARTKGNRSYPWRTVIISSDDKALLETDLVFKLAPENVIQDTQWIKPGKVAWDWWNANNIYGVDFKSGINTSTYKYYIDFASEYGLEYIILDEGWSRTTTDLMNPNSQLDLKELIDYGKSKNVGLILWTLWKPLDDKMDQILDLYADWGIKGIKVDFMARADQYMVGFYERTAAATAKRKLLLDMHGAYKPVGLNRKYPNLLNYEGVRGAENNKWEETITPEHNTVLPFTRMVAGPMDYTPGAMINSNKGEFHINYKSPMSMGTRAHQAAMYVVYDSPLKMFCDNPSNYRKDPDFSKYIASIPTTWDKTIALEAKIGSYVVVAKKHDDNWYIAGMTDWESRNFEVPLSFLDQGIQYHITLLKDGANVANHAADYHIGNGQTNASETLKLEMAQGGGFTAILSPIPIVKNSIRP